MYSNLKLINVCILFFRNLTITPPVCKSSEISKSLSPTIKPQTVCVELPKEEKSPVVCRVSKKSDKDNYMMYGIFLILLFN